MESSAESPETQLPAESPEGNATAGDTTSGAPGAAPADGAPAEAAKADGKVDAGTDAPQANGQESADATAEALTFKQHMWDRFELLWQKRVVPTQRQLQALVTSFRERAYLERQYAQGIAQSIAKLQGVAQEGGSVPLAMEAVICTMRTRAEQSASLAEALEQDVAATVEAMLRQHADVSRRVLGDGQRLVRHWQEASRMYAQCADRYAQAGLEAEIAVTECSSAAPERPTLWRPLAERAMAGARRVHVARQEYHKAVEFRNQARGLQERQMSLVFGATQDMEEKRGQCFRDTAMKLAVYDTSWLRNVQYDLDACVAQVETRGANADLQDFIQQHRSEASLPKETSPQSYKEIAPDLPAHVPSQKAIEAITAKSQERVEAMRPLLRQLLKGEPSTDDSEAALAKLKQQLSSTSPGPDGAVATGYAPKAAEAAKQAAPAPATAASETQTLAGGEAGDIKDTEGGASFRSAFCRALRLELQAIEKAAAEAGGEPAPHKLTISAMTAFVELVTAGLDGCDLEGDAWNGRDLMVHAQALQFDNDGKAMNILLKVYDHKLWSRVYFWEDALLVGLAEAHLEQFKHSQQSAETPEVVMTPFLQRYVGFMMKLGIGQEQARGSLHQTLRKCATFLTPPIAEAYFRAMTASGGGAPAGAATSASTAAFATAPADNDVKAASVAAAGTAGASTAATDPAR